MAIKPEDLLNELLQEGESPGDGKGVRLPEKRLHDALAKAYKAGKDTAEQSTFFFGQLMSSLPDHVYFKDRQSRFILINKAQAQNLGIEDPEEAIGKSDFDYFSPEDAERKFRDEQEILSTGVGWKDREEHDHTGQGEDKWVLSTKLPLVDEQGRIVGTFGISRDITEKKRAEIAYAREKELLRTLIDLLPFRIFARDLDDRFLIINEAYRRSLGIESAEEAVGNTLRDFIDDRRVEGLYKEDHRIVATGKPVLHKVEFDRSPVDRRKWLLHSKVPLRDHEGRIYGVVGMALDMTQQKEAEVRAEELLHQLEKQSERIEAELKLAKSLQLHLLKYSSGGDTSRYKGKSLHARLATKYEPSSHLAGDFYQILPISEAKFAFIVCDVMGHGVQAAIVTALICGLLPKLEGYVDKPEGLLAQLNALLGPVLSDVNGPRFVTAVAGCVDLDEGAMRLANAGHPAPFLVERETSRSLALPEAEPALGLMPNFPYTRREARLQPSSRLFAFTDGIFEQTNYLHEQFGLERLLVCFEAESQRSISGAIERVAEVAGAHKGETEQSDDICLLGIAFEDK